MERPQPWTNFGTNILVFLEENGETIVLPGFLLGTGWIFFLQEGNYKGVLLVIRLKRSQNYDVVSTHKRDFTG